MTHDRHKPLLILIFVLILLVLTTAPSFASSPIQIYIDGEKKDFGVYPLLIDGTTLLPMRSIFESLGAQVDWEPIEKKITATRDNTAIILTLDEKTAYVNSIAKSLEKAPQLYGGNTYVPVRFVSEALGEKVAWDGINRLVLIGETFSKHKSIPITLSGKSFNVNVVEVDLSSDKIGLRTVLARDRVGEVEDLKQLAARNNAIAAINGTFFSAYTHIKEPYGNLIVNGKMVHIGNFGTTIGFDEKNNVKIDRLNIKIEGETNSSYTYPHGWYSYWFNRTPSSQGSSVVIYTPEKGPDLGFNFGTSVVVEKGKVTSIKNGNVSIPKDGFVINFLGSETYLLNRFSLGTPANYRTNISPTSTEKSFWERATGAVGAGPTLVTNGNASTNPQGEGFFEDKILTNSGARSAIGVTKDNRLLLVTVNRATIAELALIMKDLGSDNAMNLDGGASSGLYYHGSYVTKTGRDISNAIVVYRK